MYSSSSSSIPPSTTQDTGRHGRQSQSSLRAQTHHATSELSTNSYATPLPQRQQPQQAEASFSARSSLSSMSINELYELTRPGKSLAAAQRSQHSTQHSTQQQQQAVASGSSTAAQHSRGLTASHNQFPARQQHGVEDPVGPHISSLQQQISSATRALRELYQAADGLGSQGGSGLRRRQQRRG
ncbi:MAG: hypothetical protein WDW38_004731 [Sanguina aurantia]